MASRAIRIASHSQFSWYWPPKQWIDAQIAQLGRNLVTWNLKKPQKTLYESPNILKRDSSDLGAANPASRLRSLHCSSPIASNLPPTSFPPPPTIYVKLNASACALPSDGSARSRRLRRLCLWLGLGEVGRRLLRREKRAVAHAEGELLMHLPRGRILGGLHHASAQRHHAHPAGSQEVVYQVLLPGFRAQEASWREANRRLGDSTTAQVSERASSLKPKTR